jgi:hypothetical protein
MALASFRVSLHCTNSKQVGHEAVGDISLRGKFEAARTATGVKCDELERRSGQENKCGLETNKLKGNEK